MRLPFNTIFEINDKGITNKTKIKISGITLEENALRDYHGQFMGVDWSLFKNRDLDLETDKGVWVIKGIY
jgi:hypothetical protein